MHVRYQLTGLLLGLLFLALAPFQVARAGVTSGQWDTGWRVDWAAGVTHTTSTWRPGTGPSTGNTTWGVSGGVPVGTSTGSLPVGRSVIDVSARVIPDRPTLAGALGRAARKLGPVGQGLALLELARELKFLISPDGLTVQKEDPAVCTVAPCFDYQALGNTGSVVGIYPTLTEACAFQTTRYGAGSCQPHGLPNTWNYVLTGGYVYYSAVKGVSKTPAGSPSYLPSTYSELETAIANKTDWGSTSKLPDAIKEAADSGEPIIAPSPTVTGPATASGPVSTIQNPDGTVTTRTTNYNITYAGNQVTYNTVNTTSITNDGVTVSTSTETVSKEKELTTCDKYPDSAGCQNLDTPSSDVLQKKTHAVSVTAVAFSSSSVCPGPLSFTVRGSSYGVSYQPLCDRLALLKTLFLALAAVLAAFIVADSFRVA